MAIISNGTTIADAGAFQASLGALVHIKTLTASNSSTLSFVDGSSSVVLDNTYPIYKFEFLNIHSTNDTVLFQFNMSSDSGSNYNVTKTSTYIYASVTESGGSGQVSYNENNHLGQSTGFKTLSEAMGSDGDQSGSGYLYLFNPSSTTFVKNFTGRFNNYHRANLSNDIQTAGYGNTTSAVNGLQFKMNSGNFDGKIKLYGIKD